ncbi:MAG: DUF5320 domain-containing protein [Dehalococcoidia bacterium]|nr:DUF5320 domain-containing protein [Dehalococcoidia bacterium]
MPDGYGRGFGRGGWGFGFRGSSPPWPYVGIGRGGLPRCGYFLSGAAGIPVPPTYPSYGSPGTTPYYGEVAYPGAMPYGGYAGAAMGAMSGGYPYAPQMTREQELDFLKSQAEAIKGQLEQIDARIKELETE